MSTPISLKEALALREFREQTLAQLQKDMERAQCWSAIDPEFLIRDLAAILEALSSERLAQLCYLIDLPERAIIQSAFSSYFESLAERIIHREALKVYLRQHFGSNTSESQLNC
ncbi:MAG: hypothetical protein RLZZ301_1573 [Bacteroidota bacterium]|jgi:hypothetical protein